MFRMKEERLKKKSDADSEVLSWVNRSRRIEEKKNTEKEKAKYLSKIFEEQVIKLYYCFLYLLLYMAYLYLRH